MSLVNNDAAKDTLTRVSVVVSLWRTCVAGEFQRSSNDVGGIGGGGNVYTLRKAFRFDLTYEIVISIFHLNH